MCQLTGRKLVASSPFALHVGSRSVAVEHGIAASLVDAQAVQLDGLCPLLPCERLVGLLLDALQVGGQFGRGAAAWPTD